LGVPENLAEKRKAHAARHGNGREGVAEIVRTDMAIRNSAAD